VQGAAMRRLVMPNKQAATPQWGKIALSLRVAQKNGVCGIAPLANGITIRCATRLASIHFFAQRVAR